MLNIITPLCFVIVAVAGDWPPQDNGQNQLRFPLPATQMPLERSQVSSPQVALPIAMPRARPCRRRSFEKPGMVSSDSSWVPITQQRIGNHPVQSQLKPQSLTENKAPANDDNNEAEKSPRNPESIDKKSSNPSQISESHKSDENERKRDILDQLEWAKADQNSAPHMHIESDNYHHRHHHTNDDKIDSHEISHDPHECEMHEEEEHHEKHSESGNNADEVSKGSHDDGHEHAVKLLSKCVEEAKAGSEEDVQGNSRRFNPSHESKNRQIVMYSKSKPLDNSDIDADSKSNTNQLEPNSVQDRQEPHLYNPAKDAGKLQGSSPVSMLQNGRVCYACSTYFDSSCWRPNTTTTVKYCYKDNNACITKTFKVQGKTILTRDCGNSCNEDNPYGGPHAKSCSMCHTDMCNSAYAIHGLNVLLVTFVISAVKYTLQ